MGSCGCGSDVGVSFEKGKGTGKRRADSLARTVRVPQVSYTLALERACLRAATRSGGELSLVSESQDHRIGGKLPRSRFRLAFRNLTAEVYSCIQAVLTHSSSCDHQQRGGWRCDTAGLAEARPPAAQRGPVSGRWLKHDEVELGAARVGVRHSSTGREAYLFFLFSAGIRFGGFIRARGMKRCSAPSPDAVQDDMSDHTAAIAQPA